MFTPPPGEVQDDFPSSLDGSSNKSYPVRDSQSQYVGDGLVPTEHMDDGDDLRFSASSANEGYDPRYLTPGYEHSLYGSSSINLGPSSKADAHGRPLRHTHSYQDMTGSYYRRQPALDGTATHTLHHARSFENRMMPDERSRRVKTVKEFFTVPLRKVKGFLRKSTARDVAKVSEASDSHHRQPQPQGVRVEQMPVVGPPRFFRMLEESAASHSSPTRPSPAIPQDYNSPPQAPSQYGTELEPRSRWSNTTGSITSASRSGAPEGDVSLIDNNLKDPALRSAYGRYVDSLPERMSLALEAGAIDRRPFNAADKESFREELRNAHIAAERHQAGLPPLETTWPRRSASTHESQDVQKGSTGNAPTRVMQDAEVQTEPLPHLARDCLVNLFTTFDDPSGRGPSPFRAPPSDAFIEAHATRGRLLPVEQTPSPTFPRLYQPSSDHSFASQVTHRHRSEDSPRTSMQSQVGSAEGLGVTLASHHLESCAASSVLGVSPESQLHSPVYIVEGEGCYIRAGDGSYLPLHWYIPFIAIEHVGGFTVFRTDDGRPADSQIARLWLSWIHVVMISAQLDITVEAFSRRSPPHRPHPTGLEAEHQATVGTAEDDLL